MAKILLIEDDEQFLQLLELLLGSAGHQVTGARDGKEGMKSLKDKHFDLIITDIFMPEQDGLAVITDLGHKEAKPKIIAISGGGKLGTYQYLKHAKMLGADATLAKPFETHELLDLVDDLLAS